MQRPRSNVRPTAGGEGPGIITGQGVAHQIGDRSGNHSCIVGNGSQIGVRVKLQSWSNHYKRAFLPPGRPVKVKEVALIVEAFIDSEKTAETEVLVTMLVAPLAGSTEMTVGGVHPH